MPRTLIVMFLILFLSACGAGDGEGLDENGLPVTDNDPGAGGGDDPDDAVDLAVIQDTIFTPRCALCHTGSNAPRGLRLDSAVTSFDNLVNVASDEIDNLDRVEPGDPDQSYLVWKIEGRPQIVGSQMPLGGPPLSTEEIALIRDWVSQGAEAPSSLATQVQSSQFAVKNKRIAVQLVFNRAIDDAAVTSESVLLFGGDPNNPQLLATDSVSVFARGHRVFIEGEIQKLNNLELIMNDSGTTPLYDVQGQLIDGDKDGIPGGEFRYEISF